MGKVLVIFYLQIALILPTKFQDKRLLIQEKKFKTDFQDGGHGVSDLNYFSYILSSSHLNISYQVLSPLAFLFRRRNSKHIFKMADMVAILDFQS